MRKLFAIILYICLFNNFVNSQSNWMKSDSSTEVGVVEHLGSTIPLDLKFVNEKNDTVSLRSIINKPTVLNFVYFDCPGLCSPLLEGISNVIEQTDMELGKEYQVVTISFNISDNPEKAREKKLNFLQKHSKSHADKWMYLTGDSFGIYSIANAVGFKFKRAGVDFIHPACIMVISPKGVITRYLYGLTFLPFDLKMAVVESQNGLARPTINRVLEFCFSYDPAGRRYVMDILKVSATIILFLLLVFGSILFMKSRTKKIK